MSLHASPIAFKYTYMNVRSHPVEDNPRWTSACMYGLSAYVGSILADTLYSYHQYMYMLVSNCVYNGFTDLTPCFASVGIRRISRLLGRLYLVGAFFSLCFVLRNVDWHYKAGTYSSMHHDGCAATRSFLSASHQI